MNHWQAWNSAGDLLDRGGNVNAHWTFNNNWRAGGGLNVDADAIDDRVTRGGPAAFVERGVNAWYYIATDDRRMVSLSYDGGTAASGHGSRSYEIAPGVTLRPMPALHVDVRLRYRRNIEDSQWVDTMPDGPNPSVFGHLDQQTVELTSRVNYTITPNLSVQLYAAPFVSGGNYQGFKQLQDPREPDYDRRYAPSAYDGNPDFNYRSFRTTNVVRWEYRPGSTLFVVWQQAREQTATSGGFNVEDLGKAFRAPGTNMFLVKLAYWFNG